MTQHWQSFGRSVGPTLNGLAGEIKRHVFVHTCVFVCFVHGFIAVNENGAVETVGVW
jgi:hypothetical protein